MAKAQQFTVTTKGLTAIAALTDKDDYHDTFKPIYFAELASEKCPDTKVGSCLIHTNGHHLLVASDASLPLTLQPGTTFLLNARAVDMAEVTKFAPSTQWTMDKIPTCAITAKNPKPDKTWEEVLSDLIASNWIPHQAPPFPDKCSLNLTELTKFTALLKTLGVIRSPRYEMAPLHLLSKGHGFLMRGALGPHGYYAFALAMGL